MEFEPTDHIFAIRIRPGNLDGRCFGRQVMGNDFSRYTVTTTATTTSGGGCN